MMFVTLKLPLSIYKAPLSQQAPEVQPEPDFGADFAKAMKAQIWGVWLIIILWKLDVIYKIMIIMISKSEFVCNRVLIIILWNLDVNWCDLLMLFLAHIIIYICYYSKFLFILVKEDNDLDKRCFTYRFSLVVPRKKNVTDLASGNWGFWSIETS